jgi:hypothetical protein
MTKSRNQSDILNGGQIIFNEDASASALTIECPSSQTSTTLSLRGGLFQQSANLHIKGGNNQTGSMVVVDGANGNDFVLNKDANPIMKGYAEATARQNNGVFDFTRANFFRCVVADDITIIPILGNLEVVSATVHIDNGGGYKISMPPNSYWVDCEEDLSKANKFIITIHSYDNGDNWFICYIGDLPEDAPF